MKEIRKYLLPELLPALLLFAAAVILFLPSLSYEFLSWDDEYYITQNGWLLNFSWGNITGIFTHSYFSNYHPLTILSYMVDFRLFGYDPTGYRAVNIVLHGLTVVASFFLLRSLGANRWVGFLLILFFAVHPLRLESVAWVSERKDVLCGLFFVLAVLFWVLGSKGDRPQRHFIAASATAFLLALFSKAMAVTFPFVILSHDLLFCRGKLKARLPLYISLFIVSALFMYANILSQSRAVVDWVPYRTRLGVATFAPLHYTMKTLFPNGLSPLYPYELRPTQTWWVVCLGLVYCVLILTAIVYCWKRHPHVSWGLLSAGFVIGPVSGIIAFGAAYAADRYTYLPTIFLLAGLAPLISTTAEKLTPPKRMALSGAGVVVCAGLTAVTLYLMPNWRDSRALWDRVFLVYPDSAKAQVARLHEPIEGENDEVLLQQAEEISTKFSNVRAATELAVKTHMGNGEYEQALAAAEKMFDPMYRHYWRVRVLRAMERWEAAAEAARDLLALDPPAFPEMRANAAWTLMKAGHPAEGLEVLQSISVPTMPGYVAWAELAELAQDPAAKEHYARNALAIFPAEPRAIHILGDLLLDQNRLAENRRLFDAAANHPIADAMAKSYAEAMIGKIAADKGNSQYANRYFNRAFHPEFDEDADAQWRAETLNLLGWTAERAARPKDAERLYEESLKANPEYLEAMLNLAFIRLQQHRPEDARTLLEKAVDLYPNDDVARQNLKQVNEAIEKQGAEQK